VIPQTCPMQHDQDIVTKALPVRQRQGGTLLIAMWAMTGAISIPTGIAHAQDKPLATLKTVLGELRQGGFVIYFRHTATAPVGAGNEAEDSANCATQRRLSVAGQTEAVEIGKSIIAIGIPIRTVTVSPYCRAKDTARLAFGRFVENRDLGFVMGLDAVETRRMAGSLRRMLATPPETRTNSVIVSHSANLFEAAGIFAKPEGAAYVFRPQSDGRFEAVARILPGDWNDAARNKPPVRPAADR